MCLVGEWRETRDIRHAKKRWLWPRKQMEHVVNAFIRWEMTKADYQTSSHFWHKHAHCLKRSGSSKWTHFGTEYILDAGLMYRDRPRRNKTWRELALFPSKGKREPLDGYKQNKRLMFSLHNCRDFAHFMSIDSLKLLRVVGFDLWERTLGGKK